MGPTGSTEGSRGVGGQKSLKEKGWNRCGATCLAGFHSA